MHSLPYVPALVAAIAHFIIGMLWYSPVLFGNIWMELNKFSKEHMAENMKKNMPLIMIGGFGTSYIFALTIGFLFQLLQVSDVMSGLKIAVILWFGFNAVIQFGMVLWEGKPFKLFVIQAAYWLASFTAVAAILSTWQ